MKKLILFSVLAISLPKVSFCISAVDSTKADSCGYALARMVYNVNNLSESGFCQLNYFARKYEANTITESQLLDSLTNISSEVANFVSLQANFVSILSRNNYTNHSSISGFDNVMYYKWADELDRRPNVGCSGYHASMWNCKAGMLACIDAGFLLCLLSPATLPICVAISTSYCVIDFSICADNAEIAFPGCGGSGGGIIWKNWITNYNQPPSNVSACP